MDNIKTEQVNGKLRQSTPVRGFVDQAAEVTGDVIELAELQVKLVKADAVDAFHRSVLLAGICLLGGLLTAAAMPIILLGLSEWIAQRMKISPSISHIAFGGIVIALAAATSAIAAWRLSKSLVVFQRSSSEFNQNVAWLKTVFRSNRSNNE